MIAKEFYKSVQNEESVTNFFLIAKNLLVNLENMLCKKCDSVMKYYIKKEKDYIKKERK